MRNHIGLLQAACVYRENMLLLLQRCSVTNEKTSPYDRTVDAHYLWSPDVILAGALGLIT